MPSYDYLVVGCGMFGSVFARCAAESGRRVLMIDKRNHIAGNCYSESVAGIEVHRYGPHVFHTDHEPVWRFVNRFARFNDYVHRTEVHHQGRLYSFPINLETLRQVWGVQSAAEAEAKLQQVRRPPADLLNLRDWSIGQIGQQLYELFIEGYTAKQWGRDPAELPASIIRRIPIRSTADDRYFDDRYQGIPIGGYTRLFENMLDHPSIEVRLGIDYLNDRGSLDRRARHALHRQAR